METSATKDAEALLANAAWVRRLARSLLGDAHLAEDVAQDALAAAWARGERIGDEQRLRRWLAGATRQLAARARWRERERPAREVVAARPEATPGDAAERLGAHRRVVDALLALEEPYRQALVLRFFDELPPRVIARRLDIRPELARQRISRGLAKLRARLDGEVEGGRAAWAALLAPLAQRGTPAPLHAIRPEVVLMSAKAATVAVGLVVATGLAWWLARGDAPGGMASAPLVEDVEQAEERHAEERAAHEDSRRSAADASVERNAAIGEQLAIRVLDEAGAPIPGAEVLLVDADGTTAREPTDADGRARFDPTDAERSALARAPGFLVGGLASLAGAGERSITLISAQTLDGRLLEDGAPPAEPLELRLSSNGGPLHYLPEELRDLAERHLDPPQVDTRTDAAGRFRFDGLAAGWSGKLWLPTTHWFLTAPPGASLEAGYDRLGRSGDDVLLIPAPARDLVLETTRLASVRGRVVWADGSGPVSRCDVTVLGEFEGERSSPSTNFSVEGDGSFEYGLASGADPVLWKDAARRPALARVWIRANPAGGLAREFVFEAAELGPSGEVGDLAVERGRRVHFVVRAPDGTPIEGARVSCTGLSEPTDAQGRGVLEGVAPDARELLVGAPRRRVLRLPLGPGGAAPDAPIELVLPPGNALELTLRGSDGRPPVGVHLVQLSSEAALFEGVDGWGPSNVHTALMGDCFGSAQWNSKGSGGRLDFSVDPEGRATIHGIRDNVPLTLRVRDRTHVVVEERFDGPSGGTLLARTTVVPGTPFELRGRVVDGAGAPLANVAVTLYVGNAELVASTGSDGRYRFAELREIAEPCALEAELGGRAAKRVEGLELRPDTALPELVLERGRSLRVRALDAAGAPLDIGRISARAPGYADAWSNELEPGRHLLEDLPPVEVTLTAWHGGREFRQPNEPGEHEAIFELPVLGTLELIAPEAAPRLSIGHLFARVTAVDDPEVTLDLYFEKEPGRRTEPVELLPGAYRVQLVRSWIEGAERREELLQGVWQVEVAAGPNQPVQL